jgi:hypothetical protein
MLSIQLVETEYINEVNEDLNNNVKHVLSNSKVDLTLGNVAIQLTLLSFKEGKFTQIHDASTTCFNAAKVLNGL